MTTLKVARATSMTAHYRGVSIAEYSPVHMTNATTTCDACGMRYEFTSHKDRCPVCCPEQKREDELDEQADWEYDEED